MYSRPGTLLVGDGTNSALYSAMTRANIATGDIAIFNRQFVVLQSTDTPTSLEDNDIIYVAQGIGTGKFLLSAPIQVANVTSYRAQAYAAPVAQVSHLGSNGTTGAITVANSTVYGVEIVFLTDQRLLPNKQDHRSIEYTSDATATQAEIATNLVNKINSDSYLSSLVTAAVVTTGGDSGISITGKPVAADGFGIDKFDVVAFKLFGKGGFGDVPASYTTAPSRGSGSTAQVKELEFMAQIGRGFSNKTQFPIATPTSYVAAANYDLIVVEHFDSHEGDHQFEMKAPLRTMIAIPNGSAALTAFKAVLNPMLPRFTAQ